jgi:protein-tyrosine kinase
LSLIERAAEKLTKLGGTVPERPLPQPKAEQPVLAGHPDVAPRLAQNAAPVVPDAVRIAQPAGGTPQILRTRSSRSVPGPERVSPNSKRFDFDLVRLSAAGFITPDAPRSQLANEFRVIKRPLLSNVKGKSPTPIARPNLIMITSAMPGEGKSFAALNLAVSVAMELDSTVLLVDGDVAQPSLSRILELPPSKGLIEVLSDNRVTLSDVILRTNIDKLSILPAGAPHERNTELLASDAMNELLNEMSMRYPDRIVIFDSPPLLPTTESRVLATHMGQIVVVVEAQKTTQGKVAQALATIEECPVVMTVLNKASRSEVGDYYGYYSY